MSDGSRAIEELKGSLETAAIQIGDTLAPIVQKVAELITALVNKFSALPEGVQQVIVVVGILVAALGPLLMVIGQISLGDICGSRYAVEIIRNWRSGDKSDWWN